MHHPDHPEPCQCTHTIRPRAIDWQEGQAIHSPREGGCGGTIPERRAIAIETARPGNRQERERDPALTGGEAASPKDIRRGEGTAFSIRAARSTTGQLSVSLGSETFTTPEGLWAALLSNTARVAERQRARAERLRAERAASEAHIDAAIEAGARSTGPAQQHETAPRRAKPKAKPSLSLSDLGL